MRALIIGGVGGMGQGVAKYLVYEKKVEEVIREKKIKIDRI